MEFNWVEWFGYLASFVVLISLTMTSIIKLRVINFTGCILFAIFAYLIDSLPTMLMNLGIACINLYYLYQIHHTKEDFKIIRASASSEYYQHFLNINHIDIEKQVSLDKLATANETFYMLRDDNIVGVLAGFHQDDGTFVILLDYVTPRYRDYKLGEYYFNTHTQFLKEKNISTLMAFSDHQEHQSYLEKMGFAKQNEDASGASIYLKTL